MVGAGRDRLLDLLERSHSTSTARPGQRGVRASTASVMPEAGEVVVLQQHEVGQRAAVVHAAAGAHRRLLERAQTGQRLAGVPDARRRPGGVDERRVAWRRPSRWHRKLSAVRSPVRTDAQRPGDRRRPSLPAPTRRRRRAATSTCTVGVDLRERLGRARGAGEHAVGARDDVGGGAAASAATSAAVRSPSGAEVLGQRARDDRVATT